MNKTTLKFMGAALTAITLFSSCGGTDDEVVTEKWANDNEGYFIVNEGNWGDNNASIDFINKKGEVESSIFETSNGTPLGDVAQSLSIGETNAAIAVNSTGKIEIVELSDFSILHTIDMSYPRYSLFANNLLYVTNGSMAGEVNVIDPTSGQITKSISVGNGPENLALINDKIVVCNNGGWSSDSTISIINPQTNTVDTTITLGGNPKDLVEDINGDIWIICHGLKEYDANYAVIKETGAELHQIDASSFEINKSFSLGDSTTHISNIEISPDGKTIYFNNNGIQSLSIDATSNNATALTSLYSYGFNVNPTTGELFTTSSSFTSASEVYKHNIAGETIDTIAAGIGTNAIVFQ